ncbi:hypothetical protein GSI_07145 [Ganoderma sinense ZZ0214-1]|uniref:Uncharacterized protein n=1 Tax=Ganoderma sinense ZZ0214-1 TaxID=1077348 RepID=A0A2G8S9L2_9APHY|nr:hypothetical protein GSI_07145 [Ganoderma sinense ZZ0214-1]
MLGKHRTSTTVEEVLDEESNRLLYSSSDAEAEESSRELEHKKCKPSKKRRKVDLPDDNISDADIEMININHDAPLQVEDNPIKDIKHFFSEPFVRDGQKYCNCWVCPKSAKHLGKIASIGSGTQNQENLGSNLSVHNWTRLSQIDRIS